MTVNCRWQESSIAFLLLAFEADSTLMYRSTPPCIMKCLKPQPHMTMVTMRHVNEIPERREYLQIAVWRFCPSDQAGSMHIHTPSALPKHKTVTSLVPIQETRMQSVQRYAKEHKPSTGPRPASSIPIRQGSSFQAGDVEAITMPEQHFTTSCGFENVSSLSQKQISNDSRQ